MSRRCVFLPYLTTMIVAVSTLLGGCGNDASFDGSLESLLESQPHRFETVLNDPDKYRVQIIYTRINRDADNEPVFKSFTYRLDDEYFYPASTVKLPTAVLALEKLNQLGIDGLDRDTAMLTDVAGELQTPAVFDATSPTGLPSVGHYVRKILLVSDNDAFNRLYEFLGQQALNDALLDKGYRDTRINHRLSVARNAAANAHTNPVVFVAGDSVIFRQEAFTSSRDYSSGDPIRIGKAEMVNGERVERPKDFSVNNRYPLQDQHDLIKALMFPQSVAESARFELSEEDYAFLYANLSGYPADSGIAAYADKGEYPDGYVKFFLFGGDEKDIPDNIRIYNKVGNAYGFLTDAAYVVDLEAGVEFLLAATIFVNENETFNDDEYEYDSIGLPFLRDLGQAIYEIELERERPHRPDLSHLQP